MSATTWLGDCEGYWRADRKRRRRGGARRRRAAAGQSVRPADQKGAAAVDEDAKEKASPSSDLNDEKNDRDGEKVETDEERAPIHIEVDIDPDRLDAPVTIRLEPGDPSGPTAASTPSES